MKALSLLIGAALLASAAAFAQTSVDPNRMQVQLLPLVPLGQTTIPAGSTFSVGLFTTLSSQSATNLYGYQFDLKFDPSKLQALEVREGGPLKNTGKSDFIPGIIDNQAGVIKTSFNSLQGKTAAVPIWITVIAEVQFKALQAGGADISLQYPVLLNETGARVPLTIVPTTTLQIR